MTTKKEIMEVFGETYEDLNDILKTKKNIENKFTKEETLKIVSALYDVYNSKTMPYNYSDSVLIEDVKGLLMIGSTNNLSIRYMTKRLFLESFIFTKQYCITEVR